MRGKKLGSSVLKRRKQGKTTKKVKAKPKPIVKVGIRVKSKMYGDKGAVAKISDDYVTVKYDNGDSVIWNVKDFWEKYDLEKEYLTSDVSTRVGDFIEDTFAKGINDPDLYHWADEGPTMFTVDRKTEKILDSLGRKHKVSKQNVMDYLMEEQ